MKRIYAIESLCNGCRLCEAFCSSLADGVFGAADSHGLDLPTGPDGTQSRIRVIKFPGEEQDVPIVDCSGFCIRPIHDDGHPTCVSLCPTGALIYEERDDAVAKRLELEAARQAHSLFKVIAPWKWPMPWSGAPAAADGD